MPVPLDSPAAGMDSVTVELADAARAAGETPGRLAAPRLLLPLLPSAGGQLGGNPAARPPLIHA